MSKPKTLKDLMIAGEIGNIFLDNLANSIFEMAPEENKTYYSSGFPYKIELPDYFKLPSHVQGFIRKALLESKVTNILDGVDHTGDLYPDYDEK